MQRISLEQAAELLNERFRGRLSKGPHTKMRGGGCCAMELRSILIGAHWTDFPDGPDSALNAACASFNDCGWFDDEDRTENCLALCVLEAKDAPEGCS